MNFSKTSILLTGAAGFIGSHCFINLFDYLVNSGQLDKYNLVIVDNFSNSFSKVIPRLKEIITLTHPQLGNHSEQLFDFVELDIIDLSKMEGLFEDYSENKKIPINHIIHFAAKKSVPESTKIPLKYYENNFVGTLNLLKCMEKFNCKNFIFSGSSSVYGENPNPKEGDEICPQSPYASTKACLDYLLRDVTQAHMDWSVISLRYFNPVGAHPSALIGDAPPDIPLNLFPYIDQVIVGIRPYLNVYGNDFPTRDGTALRDYTHVMDIANGHVAAFQKQSELLGFHAINLGCGGGSTVLEVVQAYSKIIGYELPHRFSPRRPGDIAAQSAQCDLAEKILNWKATKTLEDMCRDSYNWIKKNPKLFS